MNNFASVIEKILYSTSNCSLLLLFVKKNIRQIVSITKVTKCKYRYYRCEKQN